MRQASFSLCTKTTEVATSEMWQPSLSALRRRDVRASAKPDAVRPCKGRRMSTDTAKTELASGSFKNLSAALRRCLSSSFTSEMPCSPPPPSASSPRKALATKTACAGMSGSTSTWSRVDCSMPKERGMRRCTRIPANHQVYAGSCFPHRCSAGTAGLFGAIKSRHARTTLSASPPGGNIPCSSVSRDLASSRRSRCWPRGRWPSCASAQREAGPSEQRSLRRCRR